jgi:hypothetical protein
MPTGDRPSQHLPSLVKGVEWTFQEPQVHTEQPCTELGFGEQNWGSYLAILGKGRIDLPETTNILPMMALATLLRR